MESGSSVAQAIVSSERLLAMRAGAAGLRRWLSDRCRDGLASLADAPTQLDDQVARLHDDKLSGLARWLAFIGERVGETDRWPVVVAGELGRLAVLTEAWHRYDQLPDAVRASLLVRSGVSVRRDTVRAVGERVVGLWTTVGEQVQEDERGLVVRRTALVGPRPALVVDYQYGQSPLPPAPIGHELFAEVVFWPGAGSVRALVEDAEPTQPWVGEGAGTLADALQTVATAFAANPLVQRIPLAIAGVRGVRQGERTWLRDRNGDALPVHGDAWELIARSAAGPVTVGAVWTGRAVDVLSVVSDGERTDVPAQEVVFDDTQGLGVDARTRRLLTGADLDALLDAGAHSIAGRAAPVLTPVAEPEATVDARSAMPALVARGLERALRRHPDWLDVVVDIVHSHATRIGSPLVERLLGVGPAAWPVVDRVLGPTERRLAALDDRWRWAASVPLSVGWERPELRPACVYAALRQDEDTALVELAARWAQVERATDRVAVLDILQRCATTAVKQAVAALPTDGAVTVERAVAAVRDAQEPNTESARWTCEQVDSWRTHLEAVAADVVRGQPAPREVLAQVKTAARCAPLACADRVTAPLPGLRTTDPHARQLIAAMRDAADRIALRLRFQSVHPRPNGAMSEPVG